MTTFISRDYNAATTGYILQPFGGSWSSTSTSRLHVGFLYELSIFLQKILGYSVVGSTSWNIENTNIKSLVVTAATNTVPITITTASAHGLVDGYVVAISGGTGNGGVNGTWKVTVTSPTQAVLYGSYGTGTYNASTATMTSGFQYASGLVVDGYGAGINFGAGALTDVSIPITQKKVLATDIGKMLVLKSTAFPTKNTGIFKISARNTGNTTTITAASGGTTTIAAGSNGVSLPTGTINVVSTTGFPTSGSIFVTTSNGVQTVNYTGTTGTTFTGCTGGTGTMSTGNTVTNTAATLPQATINVVSTTGFPASGTIFVTTTTGTFAVTYTGTTATSFTGCSGGSGIMIAGNEVCNLNRYVIDYRSTEAPPVEAANSINWWLYEIETIASGYLSKFHGGNIGISGSTNATPIQITTDTNFPHTLVTGQKVTISGHLTNTNANGSWTITQVSSTQFTLNGSVGNGVGGASGTVSLMGFNGGSAAANSRIILQSPHSSGWQIRLAAEPVSSNLPQISITIGYGGNSVGDFPAGSNITNIAEFLDINTVTNTVYNNTMVGAGNQTVASRISMVGDDTGQCVVIYTRSAANNGIVIFGIPNNEPSPTPSNVNRLFCYGSAVTSDFGTIRLRMGPTLNVGSAISSGPQFAALTSWANLDGTSATNPMLSSNAGDSPFTGSTEVIPIEIWAGITCDVNLTTGTNPPFFFDPRFMGTAPFLRNGRNNFVDFSLTTDEVTSRTVTAATNASPIQITTSVANGLTTGQTVTISGVTGNTAANGTFIITVINNQNFTLNGTTGNGAYGGGGTVNGCARWLHLQNGIYLQWNGASGLTP